MKRRTFENDAPRALVNAVAATLGEPVQAAKARIEAGAVYVDGRRVSSAAAPLPVGARVTVVLEAGGVSSEQPRPAVAALVILSERDGLIAVNKPPGLPAQPTPDGEPNLLDLVSAHLGREAGLVHRLDRETSGVTVFGTSPESTSRLAAAFREGAVQKEYVAVVGRGFPERGRIDTPLQRDPSRPGRWRALDSGNGIPAATRFERERDGAHCLVRLFPETGRTHQLRAHLTSLGFPIVGDRLYGGDKGPRCLLHAHRLRLVGEQFEAPIPDDVLRAIDLS